MDDIVKAHTTAVICPGCRRDLFIYVPVSLFPIPLVWHSETGTLCCNAIVAEDGGYAEPDPYLRIDNSLVSRG